MNRNLFYILFLVMPLISSGQRTYWQQRVDYQMEIEFDIGNHQFTGVQKLTYFNNSPDTLKKVFYHLYFNAFQPGSMMDVRSRTIADPDGRVMDRISKLKDNEIGFMRVMELTQNGQKVKYEEVGTILEVQLAQPIAPGSSVVFDMKFIGQVPLQIRRSGRDNKEGISYSMAQWYPKICEYDYMGWHPNPYIGREFYGVWGDFDVKITIDPRYILGGTGYLQNPNEIGHGYEDESASVKNSKNNLTWHFKAPNVHDFMWAADPDYVHLKKQVPDGPLLHFLYQKSEKTKDWEKLPELISKAFTYANENFGKYPYKQFSVIQGGDGAMEYPMSTLLNGHRRLGSLVGSTIHEIFHSWYQGVLGTNESLYPWMDEGFTSFGSNLTTNYVLESNREPLNGSYRGYFYIANSEIAEPMTIHSDHYKTNTGYLRNAYSKGAVFVNQLGYVIGQDLMMQGMRRYFDEWKFKHPTPNDYIKVMEKISGLQLDWYKEHFINSINTIDYAVSSVTEKNNGIEIILKREGDMPMPIDLYIQLKNNKKIVVNIPLRIMRGNKENEFEGVEWVVAEDWPWTNPTYTLTLDVPMNDVEMISIDPTKRMADIVPENNNWTNKNY